MIIYQKGQFQIECFQLKIYLQIKFSMRKKTRYATMNQICAKKIDKTLNKKNNDI